MTKDKQIIIIKTTKNDDDEQKRGWKDCKAIQGVWQHGLDNDTKQTHLASAGNNHKYMRKPLM